MPNKCFIKVSVDFDSTGYMQPKSITWQDGRTFDIEKAVDCRPASNIHPGLSGDCYTVVVRGQTKHLFFERINQPSGGRIGRWYIELTTAA